MQTEQKFCGYTWEDMNRVLDFLCSIEDHMDLSGPQTEDFDIAVQCVTLVMNRLKEDRPIVWDEEAGE